MKQLPTNKLVLAATTLSHQHHHRAKVEFPFGHSNISQSVCIFPSLSSCEFWRSTCQPHRPDLLTKTKPNSIEIATMEQ